MKRLLHLSRALATRIELRPSRIGRKKLLMMGLAGVVVVGATLFGVHEWWPGSASSGASKAPPALEKGLRAARARAIADLRAHNANRTARPMQVTLKRARTADVAHVAALFATHSWYVAPPPPPPPPPAPAAASLAPPAPTAPPLPFQYIGSYKPDGEAQVFFLTHDDRVYDAKVGDTLENTYSVDGFNGSQLLLTYKPLNIQQQLMVGSTQ